MRLFELINHQVIISEEAYALKPFKAIWDKDKSKNKVKAVDELAYVFFMEDFKSDFTDILNEDERRAEILTNLSLGEKYKESKEVIEARKFYKDRINNMLPFLFLNDAKIAVNALRTYFRGVDFNKKDPRGRPIYDPVTLKKTLDSSAATLQNLIQLEEMVKKELQARDDKIGGKTKATFEDGI